MRSFSDPLIFDASGSQSVALPTSGIVSSSAVPLQFIQGFSVMAVMTSVVPQGVTGSVKLQASLDRTPQVNAPYVALANWADVTGSSVQFSGSFNAFFNVPFTYYPYFRLVYTATGGSGSMTARAAGKG